MLNWIHLKMRLRVYLTWLLTCGAAQNVIKIPYREERQRRNIIPQWKNYLLPPTELSIPYSGFMAMSRNRVIWVILEKLLLTHPYCSTWLMGKLRKCSFVGLTISHFARVQLVWRKLKVISSPNGQILANFTRVLLAM